MIKYTSIQYTLGTYTYTHLYYTYINYIIDMQVGTIISDFNN